MGVAPPCWRDTAKSRASGAPILTRTGRLISPVGTVIGASRSSREHYWELQFLSADFWGASSYRTEMILLTKRFLAEFLYFSRWLFQWAFVCDQKPKCGYISLPKHDQRFWVRFHALLIAIHLNCDAQTFFTGKTGMLKVNHFFKTSMIDVVTIILTTLGLIKE